MTLLEVKTTLYKLNNLDVYDKLSIENWLDLITTIQSNNPYFEFKDIKKDTVEAYINGTLDRHLEKTQQSW